MDFALPLSLRNIFFLSITGGVVDHLCGLPSPFASWIIRPIVGKMTFYKTRACQNQIVINVGSTVKFLPISANFRKVLVDFLGPVALLGRCRRKLLLFSISVIFQLNKTEFGFKA